MAEQPKPVRRRIVPQQIISPTKPQSESEANEATAVHVDIGSLKDHSALAEKLLGPGRKVYIDLAAYQKEQKPVNWKQILKERGIKPEKRKHIDPAAADHDHDEGPSATTPLNSWARMMRRVERYVGMANIRDEDEESSSSDEERPIDEPHPSDSEDEQGDGDGNPPADANTDVDGNKTQGGSSRAGKKIDDKYDYNDTFIDDSEHIDLFEKTDKRKPKYSGYFIALGSIDRSDELVASAMPTVKRKKQQKDKDAGKGDGEGGSGGDKDEKKEGGKKRKEPVAAGGGEEKVKKPKKKKPKTTEAAADGATTTTATTPQQANNKAPSLAQIAAAAGAGVTINNTTTTPTQPRNVSSLLAPEITPFKEGGSPSQQQQQQQQKESKEPTYIMTDDVSDAIAAIRELAKQTQPPTATEGKPVRRHLPPAILKQLRESESVFQKAYATYKNAAASVILGELMSFLEPYTKRENLRLYVCGRPVKYPGPTSNDLKKNIIDKALGEVKPIDPNAPKDQQQQPTLLTLNDIPPHVSKEVYKFIKVRLGDENINSQKGGKLVDTVVKQFSGRANADVIRSLYQRESLNDVDDGSGEGTPVVRSPSAVLMQQGGGSDGKSKEPSPTTTNTTAAAAAGGGDGGGGVPKQKSIASMAAAAAAAAAQQNATTVTTFNTTSTPVTASEPNSLSPPPPSSQQQQQQPSPTPIYTDDQIIASGIAHGAPESALRDLFTRTSSSQYARVLIRVLMHTGPTGKSISEIAKEAVEMGYATWDPKSSTVKSGFQKKIHIEGIAGIGGYKYALSCFPGVVDTRGAVTAATGGGGGGGGGDGNDNDGVGGVVDAGAS